MSSKKRTNKGKWHTHQESFFNEQVNKIGNCIPDSVISSKENKFAFEFQDKHKMTLEEVDNKNKIYVYYNYNPIWIIRIDNYAVIKDNLLVYNKSSISEYQNCKYLYLSYNKLIFHPKVLSKCLPEDIFYNIFIKDNKIPTEKYFINVLPKTKNEPTFNFIQMGAGSGKTYSIMVDALKNNNITIILTKVNIAKDAIFNKVYEILDSNEEITVNSNEKIKIQNLNNELLNNKRLMNLKQYIVEYKDKVIIIATVDSFLYNFIDEESKKQLSQQLDTFKYAAQNFDEIERINHNYKGKKIDCSTVYIDEAQDLHSSYKIFIEQAAERYNFKIILVGDILQSIYYEHNLYSEIVKDPKWKRIKQNEEYVCRRCKNYEIINFVNENIHKKIKDNDVIPIKQPIQKYSDCLSVPDNKSNIKIYNCDIVYNNDIIIDIRDSLYKTISEILEKHKDKQPRSFAFLLPYIKHYSISSYLEKILIEKLGSVKVHLFQAENGEPINLNKYPDCAKILTVHSSKGEGFDIVVSINIEPKIISRVYQHDNNFNTLMCWSMMNIAYTRAKENLYVINFVDKKPFFRWKSFYSTKDFIQRCLNEEQTNKLMSIIKKSLGDNYNKLFEKIDKNINSTLIDNNIQTLRYYIVRTLIYLMSYINTIGKNEYISNIYHGIKQRGVEYCTNSLKFKQYCNDYNAHKYNKETKYNYKLPIFILKQNNNAIKDIYTNLNSFIVESINMILEWDNNKKLGKYIYDLYNHIKVNSSTILSSNMYNNKEYQIIIYKLIFIFILMELQENPYMTYNYNTFCEIITNIDNNTFINELKYMCKSFDYFYYGKIPSMENAGLSKKFIFNKLFLHRFFIISKKYKNKTELNNSENSKCKYILLNEHDLFVISDPLNQPLSTLNFSLCCIKSLIEYILLINNNPKDQKEILVYTTSEDDKNKILEFNFRNRLSKETIDEVNNIIYESLYNINKTIIDDVIRWCKKSDNPKELIERLKYYNEIYKEEHGKFQNLTKDFKKAFKIAIEKYNKKERNIDEIINIITTYLNDKLNKLLVINKFDENQINHVNNIKDDLFDI